MSKTIRTCKCGYVSKGVRHEGYVCQNCKLAKQGRSWKINKSDEPVVEAEVVETVEVEPVAEAVEAADISGSN
jgi:hypothetical protein